MFRALPLPDCFIFQHFCANLRNQRASIESSDTLTRSESITRLQRKKSPTHICQSWCNLKSL